MFHCSVEEEVTIESLLVMQESTMANVVPKAGPRAVLLAKVAEVV